MRWWGGALQEGDGGEVPYKRVTKTTNFDGNQINIVF